MIKNDQRTTKGKVAYLLVNLLINRLSYKHIARYLLVLLLVVQFLKLVVLTFLFI